MRFILLLLLTVSSLAFGQRSQTIDADCLRIKDGICVDKLELGYLDGLTGNIKDDLDLKADADYFQNQIDDRAGIDGDETLSGIKTINGAVRVFSTDYTSLPCPVMTETQRNALVTVITGDCIYNSSSASLNIYNGTIWKTAGGGLSNWETSFSYAVNDIVIESNKIYQCLTAHTSGTFATDLAATKWLRVSTDLTGLTGLLPLSSGGTNKNATASNGAIAYSDTDSLELLAPGIPGQVLQTNGATAPSFVYPNIGAKAENTGSFFMEELQVPNNQLTTTDTNKYLLNDCGSSNNLLANCGFEHSTPTTSWTLTNGTSAVETSNVKQGKQSLKLTLTAQALDFYQASILNVAAFADGVNGSISLSIKTTVDNVYLCRTDSAGAVVASTNGTKITNCVKISNSGKWGDYVLPVILGATSNGLRLVSLTPSTAASVAVTGDIYVDAGVLEAGLKAASQGVCTDISCETEFSAKVSSADAVSDENHASFISGNCTNATTGASTCTFGASVFSSPPNCTVTMSEAGLNNSCRVNGDATTSSVGVFCTTIASTPVAVNTSFDISCQRSGSDFTNAKALASGRFYTVPSDSFSTDSNTLAHKTTAIASTDPIGTYNTYSYAINTNTKTICGTAPSILPNAADGFKIFTRAYNAASTCGNPARVEIKIGAAGTKFPTIKTDIYKSAAKVTSGVLDYYVDSTTEAGARFNSYDETTGVLIVDTGFRLASNTFSNIQFSDGVGATSGFLVINAQKAKDSIIGSFAGVNTSPSVKDPVIYSFQFSSTGVVTLDDSDLVNGNCTNANPSVCTFNSNKFSSGTVVACIVTGDNVDRSFRVLSPLATSVSFTMFVSSTGTTPALDTGAFVICKGKLP